MAVLWGVSASFALAAWLYLEHPVAGMGLAVGLGAGWTVGIELLRRRVRAPAALATRLGAGLAPPPAPIAGEADVAA